MRTNSPIISPSSEPASSSAHTVPVSVLVPTRNEERNIERCLRSESWAAREFVVDSFSSDRTVDIARAMGANVVPFRWDGHGPRKKNWALDNIPWENEWVL